MNWLVPAEAEATPAGERFRALLAPGGILELPGAHDGLAALQAREAGFRALYLSGAAMSASMGLPDLGLLTTDDVRHFVRQLVRAAQLPVLVDGDTGHGGVLNAMQLVRACEEAGAAALHLEDQLLPKKCGHLNDKRLAEPTEMAARIAAAVKARRHLYVIARTDAAAHEGIEAAIDRAKRYLDAGAEAIFPEALTRREDFERFARDVRAPLLANMTEFGRTPFFTAAEFRDMGYAMVIWPVSALRMAARAQQTLYATLRREGSTQSLVKHMQTRAELYATLGYADYEALDASLHASSLPPAQEP